MAYYEYRCEACEHFFGEELSIKKYKRRKKCPSCGKYKLDRVLDAPTLAIKGQPTTVGQLAEANTKKMGHYERQEKENRDNKELRKAKRETRKSQRSINQMTPDQQKKYIIEGD